MRRALSLTLLACSISFVSLGSRGFAQSSSLHGIDLTDLDRKAAPCDDFYEFANGTWRANNPIPASMTRWSRRWQAGETAKEKLHDILEAAAADKSAPKGSTTQLIGDYYGACMDESRANARGMDPIKPWFARIDAAHDMAALQPIMADLHDILVQVPFSFGSQPDPHKPSLVLADIGASGLSLPDRDYYLKPEPRFKEARDKYVEHVTNMFKLAGWDQKSAAAGCADQSWRWKRNSPRPHSTTLPCAIPRPSITTPHSRSCRPWLRTSTGPLTFQHKQIPTDVDMNVDQPKFMQEFDRQLQQTSLADWKVYLKWQLLEFSREFAFRAVRRGKFRLQRKVSERRDRDEAALEAVRGVRRPPARRPARTEVCGEIFSARRQSPHAGDGAQSACWPCATTSSAAPG